MFWPIRKRRKIWIQQKDFQEKRLGLGNCIWYTERGAPTPAGDQGEKIQALSANFIHDAAGNL